MDTEQWRDIEGFEGIYQVSSVGRVRSLDRYDSIGRRVRGRMLRPNLNGGYLRVKLYQGGLYTIQLVHWLVAEAFIGPRPDGMCVLHGPNGLLDNSVSNLRYGVRNVAIGERVAGAKLTEDDVRLIRRLYRSGWTQAKIRRKFDVNHVGDIVNGRSWKHVAECEQ